MKQQTKGKIAGRTYHNIAISSHNGNLDDAID